MLVDVPPRIERLRKDPRGYPIPWNVLCADDGTPFFTVNDDRKAWEALRKHLCPICGESLGRWHWWAGGPKAAFDPNGWYLDLPGHQECITYALRTCPYLAAPKYSGRIDVVHAEKLPPEHRILLDETQIAERPLLFVATVSDQVELIQRGPLFPYTRPLRPLTDYHFWLHGAEIPLHRAMPILREVFGANWEPPEKRRE